MWTWTEWTRFTYICALLIVAICTIVLISEAAKWCSKNCCQEKDLYDKKLGKITVTNEVRRMQQSKVSSSSRRT